MTRGLANLTAQTSRIDETPSLATEFDQGIHWVHGGSGSIVHHRPLVPGQLVQKRALAHVGFSDEGHTPRSALP